MVTLGVDLAAQPKKTATSLICWDSIPARVELLSTGMQDSDLHKLFEQACKIGIDAPFGWPRPFVRAIQRYSTATEWPAAEVRQLRYRRTDEVVIERVGIFPLAVAADRIAVTAMRAASLLAATAASGEVVDRSGAGRFVETYPAAALSIWGFPAKGYKGPKKKDVLAKLVSEFADKTTGWLTLTEEDQSRCGESDDLFDALLAALVARAAAIDCCEPIPPKDLDRAAEEGWIALPRPGSLQKLGG